MLQSLAHPNVTPELPVEILRAIAVEIAGPVGDHRLGMDHARAEPQTIDQRFQRRSGRAYGLGQVDKTGPPIGLIPGGANARDDLACLMVSSDDRHLKPV